MTRRATPRPTASIRSQLISLFPIVAVLIMADHTIKAVVRRALAPGDDWWIADGWIGLERSSNTGVAFGLLEGHAALPLLIAAAVIGIGWLGIVMLRGDASFWTGLGVAGIAAGGVGNVIDRVRTGAVTDFIAIGPWPRFNIADAALTCGIGLLFLRSFMTREHTND